MRWAADRGRAGFTLIEVLVTVLIMGMLMVSITQILTSVRMSRDTIHNIQETQLAGPAILDLIERDLRGLVVHGRGHEQHLRTRDRVMMGLDGDFNLRRLERYLTAISESGARPVVLLNKTDLCDDLAARVGEVKSVALDVPVLPASCKHGDGIEAVRAEVGQGRTAVLVGSSGAGKSTLINLLLGKTVQPTRQTREDDDRGRHTTTHREMFRLPGGGLLIDSPGIRELQLWGGERSLSQAFDDVEALARACRFRDCGHQSEAGCAVIAALENGVLAAQRLESYRVLQKELRHLETKQSAQRAQKQKWRETHREYRRFTKKRREPR